MKVNSPKSSRKFSNGNDFTHLLLMALPLAALLTGGALWAGYQLGIEAGAPVSNGQMAAFGLQQETGRQHRELEQARQQARAHLDAMALRLGVMQAKLLRMEALGEQLVKIGELDPSEFNFDEPPPQGGLESSEDAISVELPELFTEMDLLSRNIADRTHKLELMQGMIVDGKIQENLQPDGRPVEKGWISSNYGYRKDPFNGKKTFHRGVDIASKRGSPVHAVASGVVMEARRKSGYGYHIEINHADGLVTKYAHNSAIFVEPGDLVEKGDIIGLVGSSGRSTGPHVHFEITHNGKSVNPAKYLE
ncbi:MAG: M23 family metallopeptidase [Gammaproteobacteria bacterium]|nr:M23 family metallopeptidase [Gammaproteobacteria bacterium]